MAMSVEGLSEEWDQSPVIRTRILAGAMLQKSPGQLWVLPTRENAKLNKEVLLPCLRRLGDTKDYHLPHLPPLQVEIQKLHARLGVNPTEKTVYTLSVEIKKFLSFIKRRVNHKEITKDW